MQVGYRASSLARTSEVTNGRLARTSTCRARTTLPSAPASMRATAPATSRPQASWSSTGVRVTSLGAGRGSVNPPRASAVIWPARRAADGPSPGPATVVIHASPSWRPITTRRTTSVPGASRTNGSAPIATAPVPGPAMSSRRWMAARWPATEATAAASVRPRGSSMRRATPRPASPKPSCCHRTPSRLAATMRSTSEASMPVPWPASRAVGAARRSAPRVLLVVLIEPNPGLQRPQLHVPAPAHQLPGDALAGESALRVPNHTICPPTAATASASVAWRLRIDDVGCLPQRAGYPVPQPQLLKLLNQLGEQLAQWRQVKHAWLAVAIYYPSGLRGVGRAARLVGDVADDGVGKARSIGKADVVAAQAGVRAGRWIGGDTWRWVLRHRNHPSSGRSAGLTCIASRNASCPAPIFTAITSFSRSRLSLADAPPCG